MNQLNKVFITGVSGFIGQSIYKHLVSSKRIVSGSVRNLDSNLNELNVNYVPTGDIKLKKDWKKILTGYDCLIHCAGRAHIFKDTNKNSLELYRSINVEGTRKIAEQCVAAKIKRMIYISSIGVLGIDTNNRGPFLFSDKPNPTDNYAISKFEAEQVLNEISKNTGLEIVIIRPPIVYGASAPGNLARLINLLKLGVPLPFAGLENKRSLVGIDNLVDLITKCIDDNNAAGQIFLVSDDQDVSTSYLLSCIALAMKQSLNLFVVPLFLLNIIALILKKKKEMKRLIGSLQVDIEHTKKTLNWKPSVSFEEGINRMMKNNDTYI